MNIDQRFEQIESLCDAALETDDPKEQRNTITIVVRHVRKIMEDPDVTEEDRMTCCQIVYAICRTLHIDPESI